MEYNYTSTHFSIDPRYRGRRSQHILMMTMTVTMDHTDMKAKTHDDDTDGDDVQ